MRCIQEIFWQLQVSGRDQQRPIEFWQEFEIEKVDHRLLARATSHQASVVCTTGRDREDEENGE